jgi:NAD(P)-dependent dehydrogenase (short-subunit alcohol dehydrogenase family)
LTNHFSISLTSGVYGKRPPKGGSKLAAINSALEGLMRGLTVDLAPFRVNVVSPINGSTEKVMNIYASRFYGLFFNQA